MSDVSEKLNWDHAFTADDEGEQSAFVIVPEGNYVVKVVKAEKGSFQGSAKMAACPKMTLTLQITTDEGNSVFKTTLFLSANQKWKILAAFVSLGLRNHGDNGALPWDKLLGAVGYARIGVRKYMSQDNVERETNELIKWLDMPKAEADAEDEDY